MDVAALTLTFCIQVQLVTCLCMWVYKITYIHTHVPTNVFVGALRSLYFFFFILLPPPPDMCFGRNYIFITCKVTENIEK